MSASVPDQSWHNPKSRWRRRMRFSWIMSFIGAAFFLVVAATMALLWLFVVRRFALDVSPLPLWLMIGSAGGTVAATYFGLRVKRLARLVPALDGRVCPWCRREMADRGEAYFCARCDVERDQRDVREHWANFALATTAPIEWKLKNHPRYGHRWTKWLAAVSEPGAERKARRAWIAFAAILNVATILVIALMAHSVIQVAILGAILIGLTAMLLMVGWDFMRPAPPLRFCTNCRYQFPPGDAPPERCPECGSDWTKPGAAFAGSGRDLKRLVVAFGIAAIIFTIALMHIVGPTTTALRYVPNETLINRIIAGRAVFLNWSALEGRALTKSQAIALAEGLLETRQRDGRLYFQVPNWIMGHVLAGNFDNDFAHRYFDEMATIAMTGPERIRIGETASLELHTIMRQSAVGGAQSMYVYFAGAETDDGRVIAPPWERANTLETFGHTRVVNGSSYDPSRYPELNVETTGPGEMTVTVRMWLVVDVVPRAGGTRTIEWLEDGSPEFVDTVLWSKPVVLEHSIVVVE